MFLTLTYEIKCLSILLAVATCYLLVNKQRTLGMSWSKDGL